MGDIVLNQEVKWNTVTLGGDNIGRNCAGRTCDYCTVVQTSYDSSMVKGSIREIFAHFS